ncbi:MAG: hypothetical protein NTX25_17095 [Proteobacteria bacterium]|nr:hypothetical protein [Pseudomonadota bacterium]
MQPILKMSALLACITLSGQVLADASQFANRHVRGHGEYFVPDQNPTGHSLELFSNGTGQYCPRPGSCGKLSNIQYNVEGFDLVGVWEINGSRGTFFWNFQGQEFSGGFRFNQNLEPSEGGSIYVPNDGNWNGRLN